MRIKIGGGKNKKTIRCLTIDASSMLVAVVQSSVGSVRAASALVGGVRGRGKGEEVDDRFLLASSGHQSSHQVLWMTKKRKVAHATVP